MAIHQGMYNIAREDGKREAMAGLQQRDAVDQMVAQAHDTGAARGYQAGEQSGADKAIQAVMAGLGAQQGQPQQQQPQFTEQDVMQVAAGIQGGQITQEQAVGIDQQAPGIIQAAMQMLQATAQQATQGPAESVPQAGLSPQAV